MSELDFGFLGNITCPNIVRITNNVLMYMVGLLVFIITGLDTNWTSIFKKTVPV